MLAIADALIETGGRQIEMWIDRAKYCDKHAQLVESIKAVFPQVEWR